jgi:hypothetical protein
MLAATASLIETTLLIGAHLRLNCGSSGVFVRRWLDAILPHANPGNTTQARHGGGR